MRATIEKRKFDNMAMFDSFVFLDQYLLWSGEHEKKATQ
jgi:hypothetical protein